MLKWMRQTQSIYLSVYNNYFLSDSTIIMAYNEPFVKKQPKLSFEVAQLSFEMALWREPPVEEKVSSNERAWKMQKKMSCYWPQYVKWFSRYPISKSGIWAGWTSPFCRFLARFSLKYDVRNAILQDIEKMKVQYLRSLLFDLFEILQAVRSEQRNFACFKISLL